MTEFSDRGFRVLLRSKRAHLEPSLVKHLTDFIDQTAASLDCAIYDLRHPEVLAAFKRVVDRGKKLRLVYDAGSKPVSGGGAADPKPTGTAQAITAAGLDDVATPFFEHGHLMHDKFLVRDGSAVWTGSANFTVGGLELQDNNCLEIVSKNLAEVYGQAFERVVATAVGAVGFSADLPAAPDAEIVVGGETVSVSFAPAAGEGIEQEIVAALAQAKSVRLMAFLISDPGTLEALARFKDAGADIAGVIDPNGMADARQSKNIDPSLWWFTTDPRFAIAPSHPFNPKGEQDFMHMKSIVLDDRLVFTGSYNFSENAELNSENELQIKSQQVAAAYTSYFNALFGRYPKGAAAEQVARSVGLSGVRTMAAEQCQITRITLDELLEQLRDGATKAAEEQQGGYGAEITKKKAALGALRRVAEDITSDRSRWAWVRTLNDAANDIGAAGDDECSQLAAETRDVALRLAGYAAKAAPSGAVAEITAASLQLSEDSEVSDLRRIAAEVVRRPEDYEAA
jgi:phosphatidylserine/phosphatidylglycerophosphate/cardiolipin synthase-like enzyme